MASAEDKYIKKRIIKGSIQSIPFYICRLFPVKKKKIVFCCIEGTTGYSCNPKYIAKEFIKNHENDYELVWLVNDTKKSFPKEIKAVRNTLWNRAYHLSTAKFWIDNSRKQLECRKRSGQIYIQTWHAKLGFKPTCLDRGASFSKIAYLVSKHDSDMVDYWLSNSDWYDKTLKTGSLYEGKILRTGSPRCDILVRAKKDKEYKQQVKNHIYSKFVMQENVSELGDIHFMMYAPTFRGGSQGTNRTLDNEYHMPDFDRLRKNLETKFGGQWYILLRLHPQMVVRGLVDVNNDGIIDVSKEDDMYEILAGCDAFMSDYSSAAFDAAVMEIPAFLYCDDYKEYENERGSLLWDLKKLPFVFAQNDDELMEGISRYNSDEYISDIRALHEDAGVVEDGEASKKVVDFIKSM